MSNYRPHPPATPASPHHPQPHGWTQQSCHQPPTRGFYGILKLPPVRRPARRQAAGAQRRDARPTRPRGGPSAGRENPPCDAAPGRRRRAACAEVKRLCACRHVFTLPPGYRAADDRPSTGRPATSGWNAHALRRSARRRHGAGAARLIRFAAQTPGPTAPDPVMTPRTGSVSARATVLVRVRLVWV